MTVHGSWFGAKTKKANLKKQSQFAPDKKSVKLYIKGGYSNMPAFRVEENKANQSQFLYRQPGTSVIIFLMLDAGHSMLVGYRVRTRIKNRNENYD
jgi:hypothetical protein